MCGRWIFSTRHRCSPWSAASRFSFCLVVLFFLAYELGYGGSPRLGIVAFSALIVPSSPWVLSALASSLPPFLYSSLIVNCFHFFAEAHICCRRALVMLMHCFATKSSFFVFF
ncbi:hypothetical protein M758_UG050300, partial [Ceratodon purpureus]